MQVTTYFVIATIILLVVILFRSENKFEFLKAAILFLVQIFFSSINFFIFIIIAIFMMNELDHISLGNLFMLLAVCIILSGIFLFWGMRLAARFLKFSTTTLTLVEYYIQWSLIYVTVYQVIFANIKNIKEITDFIRIGNFLDPDDIVVLLLPSFISAWIAVVLYKKLIKAI